MDVSEIVVKAERILYGASPNNVFNVDVTENVMDVQPLFSVVDGLFGLLSVEVQEETMALIHMSEDEAWGKSVETGDFFTNQIVGLKIASAEALSNRFSVLVFVEDLADIADNLANLMAYCPSWDHEINGWK